MVGVRVTKIEIGLPTTVLGPKRLDDRGGPKGSANLPGDGGQQFLTE